jgi:ABC-type Fe3+/spermidine/putrescine transport system ATPase subunit
VVKKFGSTVALRGVSLDVRNGELFALLGPSGCGKTTLLRIIAGFEKPDQGIVYIDGEDVTRLPPDRRGTVMVFQNWALWPHMTVFDNIAFGLRLQKVPESEVRTRVKRVVELLGLEGLENRYPGQLSGGQQQRVALARALVVEPRVLLLDEPLSNLDARLRLKLRGELKKLQRRLGITAIYVTHDQEEAMSLADRMAVMRSGTVEQVGTPNELYTNPSTLFTALFLGKTSIVTGDVVDMSDRRAYIRVGELVLKAIPHKVGVGDRAAVVVKAEGATLTPPQTGEDEYVALSGRVVVALYLGMHVEVRVNPPASRYEVAVQLPAATSIPPPGSEITVYLPQRNVHAYPIDEEVLRAEGL